jgi:hypothetical protein
MSLYSHSFKKHVNKRVANATKALHSISRLQNPEWELSSMTSRQLYITCISATSDYDSEIWWKNQKQCENKLQKLQNATLKKILEAFRISPIVVMKIETNLKSINIRLDQKNQKLELRMLKIKKNHSIRLKNPNFPLKNWNETLNEQSRECLSQTAIQKQNCEITWCDYSHVMWLRWLCIERNNFDSNISTYIESRSS